MPPIVTWTSELVSDTLRWRLRTIAITRSSQLTTTYATVRAVWTPRTEPHAHFSCRRCGAVADLDVAIDARRAEDAARATGGDPAQVDVVVRGVCAACRVPRGQSAPVRAQRRPGSDRAATSRLAARCRRHAAACA